MNEQVPFIIYAPLSAYRYQNTSFQRSSALAELFPKTKFIDTTTKETKFSYLSRKLYIHSGIEIVVNEFTPKYMPRDSYVYIESPWLLSFDYIKALKRYNTIILNFVDNLRFSHNRYPHLLRKLKLADIIISTKPKDVGFFRSLGTRAKIQIIDNGVNLKFWPRIPQHEKKLKFDFVFFGSYEKVRRNCLERLADAGFSVAIVGNNWGNCSLVIGGDTFGTELAQFLESGRLAINFLREMNQDSQTTRTMELGSLGIPTIHQASECHRRIFIGCGDCFFQTENFVSDCVRVLQEDRGKLADAQYRVISNDYSYQKIYRDLFFG